MRTVAIGMAGFYAVLAGLGDGLHVLAHAQGVAAAKSGTDCCECGCLFGQLGRQVSVQAGSPAAVDSAPSASESLGGSEKQLPAHGHDCEVCKLLAQLKVASIQIEARPVTVKLPDDFFFFTQRQVDNIATYVFGARGPPIAA